MGLFDIFTKGNVNNLDVKSDDFMPMAISQSLGLDVLNLSQDEQNLINKGYGGNVIVYAIIKRIAQSGADLTKVLIDENNPEEIIEDGEVYDMLLRPALLQGEIITQYNYFESIITTLLASGNVYQRGIKATGFGDAWERMEIIPSGCTTPIVGNSYLYNAQGYLFRDRLKDVTIPYEDIMHTKYFNPTTTGLASLEGLSPLQASIYSLTGSTDIQKAISVITKNQGARGILTNEANRTGGGVGMSESMASKIKSAVNNVIRGIDKIGSVQVTNASLKYLPIGMSSADLKLVESGVLTDRQLCNAFGVKSNLFNDISASTESNVKEATKSFYNDAVIPTVNKILSDINNNWLAQHSKRDNKKYKLILDTSTIEALQGDQKEEAEKDKINMEGINIVLNMPISSEAKQTILIDTYGYGEESAKVIANTIINE